jgi:hypothetical protein
MYNWWSQNTECNLKYIPGQLLWNIENSNQLPQQLKHMRTKFYIYECTCPSQNLISDVLLCFLIPFSEIVSFVSYQKGLFQYFVKSKWQVWICFHFICMPQIYTNYYGILKTPINYRNNLSTCVPNSTSYMQFQNTVFHGDCLFLYSMPLG